jgi:hypothetical protein
MNKLEGKIGSSGSFVETHLAKWENPPLKF